MSKFARNFGISRYKADAHGSSIGFTRWRQCTVFAHPSSETYLARELCRVADMDCRRRPRSASTLELTRSVTVGDRAFAVSAARV